MLNHLKAIPFLCYSATMYRRVAQRWKGWGLYYLFTLLLVAMTLTTVRDMARLNRLDITDEQAGIEQWRIAGNAIPVQELLHVIRQFPVLEVRGGALSAQADQPLVIRSISGDMPVVIIDTTGEVTSLQEHRAMFLITAKDLRQNDGVKDQVLLRFNDIPDQVIAKEDLLRWMKYAPLMVMPQTFLLRFVAYSMNAFMWGLMGLLLARWWQLRLDYKQLVRLGMAINTPIILLELMSGLLGMQLFSNPMLVYLCINTAYMYHAVEAQKK